MIRAYPPQCALTFAALSSIAISVMLILSLRNTGIGIGLLVQFQFLSHLSQKWPSHFPIVGFNFHSKVRDLE